MTREELEKVFESEETNWEGDNCYQGLQIIAKYTKNVVHGASHDKVFSESIDELIEAGITLEDVTKLRMINWMIEEDCLSCYV
jgi:hypothetical protein